MAAVTFNAMPRTEQVRRRLKAGFALHFSEMLDAFVSNRMRRAAAGDQTRWSAGPSKPT